MSGVFRDNFDPQGLGDLIEVSEDEGGQGGQGGGKPAKKQASGLPTLDGPETVAEFVNKFKKTLLSKRQARREVMDRLEKDKPKGAEHFDAL